MIETKRHVPDKFMNKININIKPPKKTKYKNFSSKERIEMINMLKGCL